VNGPTAEEPRASSAWALAVGLSNVSLCLFASIQPADEVFGTHRGQCEVHFEARGRGRKELEVGASPSTMVLGRVPRVSRLLALAHRLDRLLRAGVVKDYAEAARLGHVTRARISQVMSLLS
jgi:hypothetical protein